MPKLRKTTFHCEPRERQLVSRAFGIRNFLCIAAQNARQNVLQRIALRVFTSISNLVSVSVIACVAGSFAVPYAHANHGNKPLHDYVRRTWSVDNGLPQSTVRAIAQTADGYLWLSNHQGLIRFDGKQFQVFSESNTPALVGSGVSALLVSSDGGLWIGLRDGGVVKMQKGIFTPLPVKNATPKGTVTAMRETADGRLWVATSGGGLGIIEGSSGIVFTTANGLPHDNVLSLQAMPDGAMYVGTSHGLAVFRNGKLTDERVSSMFDVFDSYPINAMHVDYRGRLWVGVSKIGLFRRDAGEAVATDATSGELIGRTKNEWTLFDRRHGVSDQITKIHVDRHDNVWIGNLDGLQRFHDDKVESLNAQNGLSSNYVRDIFEDVEANIWIGTEGGLDQIRDGAVTMWSETRGLKELFSRAVLEDNAGTIWVGTADGLYHLSAEGSVIKRYDRDAGFASTAILSLAESREGKLWVGTNSGGLHYRQGERWVNVGIAKNVDASPVRALLPINEDTLLIGTAAGLYLAKITDKLEKLQPVGAELGIDSPQILTLKPALQPNHVWVGTRGGLFLLELSASPRAKKIPGIQHAVFAVLESGGALLAATSHGLMARHLPTAEMHLLGATQGLANNAYFQILEGSNDIWMCSVYGMVRIEKASLQRAIRDGRSIIKHQRIDKADGMTTQQCNGGSQPAGAMTLDGRILFPTAKGVAIYNPAHSVSRNLRQPPVHITSVVIDGEALSHEALSLGQVTLRPQNKRIEFRFVGLSYVDAGRVQYRFRMDGYEPDWINIGADQRATYTNLAPGNYRFLVSAANNDGIWNEQPAEISITRESPFYDQPLFRIGLGVLLLLLLVFAYFMRTRMLRYQSIRLRTQVVARTLDIEAQKTQLENANNEKSALLEQLQAQSAAYEHLSKTDSLTGIPNRRELDRALEAEWKRIARTDAPLSVIIADVDYFKLINDRYSHAVGDAALRKIAALLTAGRRDLDVVARYGGEEFVLLLPETELASAVKLADGLRERIAQYDWSLVAADLHVTMSFGIAEARELPFGSSAERLIMAADAKLYQAKSKGRNNVVA